MINGATQIIGDVPAVHLDALLLVKSQRKESTGFVMIAYEHAVAPDVQGEEGPSPIARFYDLLFFRGSVIFDSARLNQDLRFKLNIDTALRTFAERRDHAGTSLFLFAATEDVIHRFRSTFYYEPCLKVQIESLSKKQIVTLLTSSRCQHGIVECNEFTQKKPAIELTEIQSIEELSVIRPAVKHGRLLLYDIEKNREIIQERYATTLHDISVMSAGSSDDQKRLHDTSRMIVPSQPEKKIKHFHISSGDVRQHGDVDTNVSVGSVGDLKSSVLSARLPESKRDDGQGVEALVLSSAEAPVLSKAEASEFTEFIQRILNSPMSQNLKQPVEEQETTRPNVVIRVQEEIPTPRENVNVMANDLMEGNEHDNPKLNVTTHDRKRSNKRTKQVRATRQIKKTTERQHEGPATDAKEIEHPRGTEQNQESISEFVRLFERLVRSFRQQVFECFGNRCEEIILQAEKKLRLLSPDFDCHSLTEETAPVTLDLVEEIVKESSFLKRPKLRQAAITLISDLYNKQYNLLEGHRAIDKVEQVYYRLKK